MIFFVITKIIAIVLAIYIVRRAKHYKRRPALYRLSFMAGIGFTLLAVAPFVLNVPKIMTTASIDLAILCLSIAGLLYYTQRKENGEIDVGVNADQQE